jgi:hypothetical protein
VLQGTYGTTALQGTCDMGAGAWGSGGLCVGAAPTPRRAGGECRNCAARHLRQDCAARRSSSIARAAAKHASKKESEKPKLAEVCEVGDLVLPKVPADFLIVRATKPHKDPTLVKINKSVRTASGKKNVKCSMYGGEMKKGMGKGSCGYGGAEGCNLTSTTTQASVQH